MNHEQILWGAVAILTVFILNQIFGRMISEVFSRKDRKDDNGGPSRKEHEMCSQHTREALGEIKAQLEKITTKLDRMIAKPPPG